MKRKLLTAAFASTAALLLASASAPSVAQTYPTKPITFVVGFAAGGPTDIVARTLADAMSKTLGQNVLVENKAGVGGVIGVGDVAKAQPDGYRLLVHHIGMSTAPALYRKLAFDPLKDFEYAGLINEVPMVLVTKPGLPAKNLKDLNAYLAANKNRVTFANAGLGAASHLCGLLFMSTLKLDLTTVPYKGTAPAMSDLIGGQVDLLCDQTTSTTAQIKAGRVQPIAITSAKRLGTMADIPTTTEGGMPGFQVTVWHGLYAPKGTPKPVMDKIVAAMQAALADPAVAKRFADLGAETVSKDRQTPEALEKHLRAEIAKWTPIIKAAGEYAD
jgi:tripartite-type tricarboxylate transporter receptor subunit TctC